MKDRDKKKYIPFNQWEIIGYEVRYRGDVKLFDSEERAFDEGLKLIDYDDIFGKSAIYERRQNPYCPDVSEHMMIGSVDYMGRIKYMA